MLGFRLFEFRLEDGKWVKLDFDPYRFGVYISRFNNKDENFVMSQSTGLKDCDGKEIFEGDVVEKNAHREKYNWITPVEDINQFLNKCYIYVPDEFPDSRYFKILGNIYENPELLELVKHENVEFCEKLKTITYQI
jgi:uncharacterized phage protein (TIGR01671 family)